MATKLHGKALRTLVCSMQTKATLRAYQDGAEVFRFRNGNQAQHFVDMLRSTFVDERDTVIDNNWVLVWC